MGAVVASWRVSTAQFLFCAYMFLYLFFFSRKISIFVRKYFNLVLIHIIQIHKLPNVFSMLGITNFNSI